MWAAAFGFNRIKSTTGRVGLGGGVTSGFSSANFLGTKTKTILKSSNKEAPSKKSQPSKEITRVYMHKYLQTIGSGDLCVLHCSNFRVAENIVETKKDKINEINTNSKNHNV